MQPDPDWYIDHVVVASGPEYAPIGPIRAAQAEWYSLARGLARGTGLLGPAQRLAATQGFVLTRRQARTVGVSESVARRLLRSGAWTAPRYGVLSPVPASAETLPALRASALALVWSGTVVSHASAAAMHGLPLLEPPDVPTVTAGRGACSRRDVRVHVAAAAPDEIDDWYGTPVLAVERVVCDLARSRGTAHGLVAADAALHERVTSVRRLRRTLRRQRGWPGVRAARRAVQLADARAESPLESLTRLCLLEGGLPRPDVGQWVDTAARAYRVDMLYRARRVVVECDGLTKYVSGGRSLVDEKRRQEHLVRADYRVVRVLWEDVVDTPRETVARVRAALLGQ